MDSFKEISVALYGDRSDLLNGRFGLPCGLKSDTFRGPTSAPSGCTAAGDVSLCSRHPSLHPGGHATRAGDYERPTLEVTSRSADDRGAGMAQAHQFVLGGSLRHGGNAATGSRSAQSGANADREVSRLCESDRAARIRSACDDARRVRPIQCGRDQTLGSNRARAWPSAQSVMPKRTSPVEDLLSLVLPKIISVHSDDAIRIRLV